MGICPKRHEKRPGTPSSKTFPTTIVQDCHAPPNILLRCPYRRAVEGAFVREVIIGQRNRTKIHCLDTKPLKGFSEPSTTNLPHNAASHGII
jgi:hypothetical protein